MSDSRTGRLGMHAVPWLLAALLLVLVYQGFFHVPRWEHHWAFVGAIEDETGETMKQQLNALGNEGWELVSFDTHSWDDDRVPVTARCAFRRKMRGP